MSSPSPASRARLAAGVTLSLLLAGVAGAALLSRLPTSNEIAGWTVMTGGDRAATNQQGLYSLYDGAAPEMIRQGIALASQRVYKRDAKRLTIEVYKFATPAQAKTYYSARKAEISHSKAFRATGSSVSGVARAISGRTYVAYLWQQQLCCTMSVNGTTVAEKTALEAFAASIGKKITAQQ